MLCNIFSINITTQSKDVEEMLNISQFEYERMTEPKRVKDFSYSRFSTFC